MAVWEDPPAVKTSKGERVWPGVIAELKRHPGRWARIFECEPDKGSSTATYLRTRYHLELVTRTIDGRRVFFARWPEPTDAERNGDR
jgi:hypothetical protein